MRTEVENTNENTLNVVLCTHSSTYMRSLTAWPAKNQAAALLPACLQFKLRYYTTIVEAQGLTNLYPRREAKTTFEIVVPL